MDFKIRCSGIAEIMAEPRTKTELISVGAKTHVKKWVKDTFFGRRELIKSKYLQKGIDTEEQALNVLVQVLKLPMIYKNDVRMTDDFKTGECDFITGDVIYDNKSSFSFDTFPLFEDKLDPKYYAQMQGYLSLWGLERGRVAYTLVDTPMDILERELRWIEDHNERQQKAMQLIFTDKYWQEAKEKLFPQADVCRFISIENKYRVKVFDVKYNPEFINKVHQKVLGCRGYVKELERMLNDPQR